MLTDMRLSHHLLMQLARENERESLRKAEALPARRPDPGMAARFVELMQRCFPAPVDDQTSTSSEAAVVPQPEGPRHRARAEIDAASGCDTANRASEGRPLTARRSRERSARTTAAR
jgi:hypothetical protein